MLFDIIHSSSFFCPLTVFNAMACYISPFHLILSTLSSQVCCLNLFTPLLSPLFLLLGAAQS